MITHLFMAVFITALGLMSIAPLVLALAIRQSMLHDDADWPWTFLRYLVMAAFASLVLAALVATVALITNVGGSRGSAAAGSHRAVVVAQTGWNDGDRSSLHDL